MPTKSKNKKRNHDEADEDDVESLSEDLSSAQDDLDALIEEIEDLYDSLDTAGGDSDIENDIQKRGDDNC